MTLNKAALVKLFKDALTKELSLDHVKHESSMLYIFKSQKCVDIDAFCQERARVFLLLDSWADIEFMFTQVLRGKITTYDEGICRNFRLPVTLKHSIFVLWDKYSGDVVYPVPNVGGVRDNWGMVATPERLMQMAANDANLMWGNTGYGNARRELLAFVQQKISELISK